MSEIFCWYLEISVAEFRVCLKNIMIILRENDIYIQYIVYLFIFTI